jgi:predicted MFS family arabinose efflux permease
MTGAFLISTILASIFMSRLADSWSPHHVMSIGALAACASAVIAWLAPSAAWFYLSLILASMGIVAIWTIPIPLSVRFGNDSERPYYIGLANTFASPATILAPFLGGWLANVVGFQTTFQLSTVSGLLISLLLTFILKDPPRQQLTFTQPSLQR